MTSRYEGMPMTMLEAKSLGLPVVSYDFPCGPKDLIEDGKDGFLVPEGDKNTFSNCLISLMDDDSKRREFGLRSKKNSQAYTEANVMKKWKELFIETKNS